MLRRDIGGLMKDFEDLVFEDHPSAVSCNPFDLAMMGMAAFGAMFEDQAKMFFDNGYGVSVVTGSAAYSEYEIAILKGDATNSELCYDTPITSDVVPCDTEDDVSKIMKQVQEL